MEDLRPRFAKCEADADYHRAQIRSRIEAGERIDDREAWSQAIDFPKPVGTTAYLAGPVDALLGVLPFYDFLYVPVLSGYLHELIDDEDDFRSYYGIDTRCFLDLVEAGKIIPVFDDSVSRYSDFIVKQIWGYLAENNLHHMLFWQLSAIGVAFQSRSQIMLPWNDPDKSVWWTEMMINACALDGRVIARYPSNISGFIASRSDFDRLYAGGSPRVALDAETLDYIARCLSLSYSSQIPVSKYLDVLDSKTGWTLRKLFESAASLDQAKGDGILDMVAQYNALVDELAKSGSFRLARVASDLFTKHILSVSLAVAGGVIGGGPLPGMAGLIVGAVADKVIEQVEIKAESPMRSAKMGLTSTLA
jgi:hypothetical protein